ncbi:MAG: hypothetical protein AAB457_03650 [Patescibacteria group bacterium]
MEKWREKGKTMNYLQEGNPHTKTTDIVKPKIIIVGDDEATDDLPPGTVKLGGSPAREEEEQKVLEETTF